MNSTNGSERRLRTLNDAMISAPTDAYLQSTPLSAQLGFRLTRHPLRPPYCDDSDPPSGDKEWMRPF